MRWAKYILVVVVAALLLFVFQAAAEAQCAMCRASLSGSNNSFFVRNLNIGVLVLLVPPVTIFCSIFIALKRRRDSDKE